MSLNFAGLSYVEVKRDVRKSVEFIPSVCTKLFVVVAQIYTNAKLNQNIVGPVLDIFVKDKIIVKWRVTWEPKSNTLVGFCGPSINHFCLHNLTSSWM